MAKARTAPNIAIRVALIYALAAALWIVGSGLVVFGLPEPLAGFIEVGKGLGFVLVTAVLLYFVLARWSGTLSDRLARAEESLAEADALAEQLPAGIVLLDSEQRVSLINPAAETLLRRRSAETVGRPFADVCAEAGGLGCAEMIPQLLGTGVPADSFTFRDDSGDERTIVVRAAAADSTQPSLGWMVVLTDETEVAERLRRSERRLAGYRFAALVIGELSRARDARQLLGKVCDLAVEPGGFAAAWAIVRDRSGGGFVDAGMAGLDPGARAVAEQMRAGADAATSSLLASVAEGQIVYENVAEEGKDAAWRGVASGSGIGSYAAFGLVENGQLLVVVSLFASETGFFGLEEQALVGALRDEIEFALERLELDRKRLDAEEALAKSEHAYRRFFEDNPLPMWIYDPQTFEFLAVNDAAAAKYGYTRDQFRRMTIKDIRPAADVASLVDHVAHTGAGFEDAGFWTHVDSEGREFPVHVVTHDTEWEGRAARLVLVQEIAQVR